MKQTQHTRRVGKQTQMYKKKVSTKVRMNTYVPKTEHLCIKDV